NGRGDVENRIKEGKNALRGQSGQVAHGSAGLQPPPHASAILPHGRRGQTVSGMAHQASHQGGSESRVSRSEVASSCGISLPLGPVLPSSVPVRVKKSG